MANLWPASTTSLLRSLILAVAGSAFIAIAAQIVVPFFTVPMTMQVFAVLLIGLTYGRTLGLATLMLYLAEGAAGLPVFAGDKFGLATFLGPTGGYLLGFALCAGALGWLAEKGFSRGFLFTILSGLLGLALIYVPGLAWLGFSMGWEKPILEFGFFPFILADLLKLGLAAATLHVLWRRADKGRADKNS